MTINVTHQGIELTTAINAYIQEKMEGLSKYFDGIRHIDVVVGKTNRFEFFCHANVQTNSEVVRVERSEDDLYKAIDKVRDHLRVELSDLKKRLQDHHVDEMIEEASETESEA